MPDTIPVEFRVLAMLPVTGRGRLLYLADVTLEIAGVELVLQGVQVVRDEANRLVCGMPQFRHPTTGTGHPAVVLPVELEDAIAAELLGAVPSARVRRVGRVEE